MTTPVRNLSPEDFGPALRGRHRRGGRSIARVLVAIVGVLVLGAGATVFSLAWVGASSVRTVDIGGRDRSSGQAASGGEEPVLEEVQGVTNVLLVGSDSREGLTDEDLLRLGTDAEDRTGLTDTIMLVQLDAEDDRASVLSFPRDLLVTHCDGTKGRINAAYEYGEELRPGGGAKCLVTTVENLTGVLIDHYVQVDFQGFMKAVDAIGGVDFYIDQPLVDAHAGLDIKEPGCVHFDGAKALGFVRARYLDPAADFGRIARQQRFMREMVDKAASLEVLANPARLLGLVRSVGGAVTVDPGLASPLDQANLAYTFRELSNAGIDTHVVPGADDTWNGADILRLDERQAEPLFAQFRRASAPDPPVAGQAPPAPSPEAAQETEIAAAPVDPNAPPIASSAVEPEPQPEPSPSFKGAAASDVQC